MATPQKKCCILKLYLTALAVVLGICLIRLSSLLKGQRLLHPSNRYRSLSNSPPQLWSWPLAVFPVVRFVNHHLLVLSCYATVQAVSTDESTSRLHPISHHPLISASSSTTSSKSTTLTDKKRIPETYLLTSHFNSAALVIHMAPILPMRRINLNAAI